MFTNIVDFGLNVQEAVEAPRSVAPASPSPLAPSRLPNRLQVEARLAPAVIDALNARGHQVEVGAMGCQERLYPILVNPETVYHGGADPRKESVMLGW